MKKGKIAVITSGDIPSKWAHGLNTAKHADAFFKLGCNVEILTVERILEDFMKLILKNVHYFYDINEKIKIKYFKDKSFFYFYDLPVFKYILLKLKAKFPNITQILDPEKKISNYCRNQQFNLVYCRTYRVAYYNIKKGIPTIIESHNYSNSPDLLKLLKLNRKECFKGIVTISEVLKRKFVKNGVPREKVLVLEDAADLDKFDKIIGNKKILRNILGLPLNKKIILYAGRLSDYNGIDIILKAASLVNNNSLEFYIIGGNRNDIKKWKRYIAKKKIVAKINFLGFKPNKEIPLYLKAADILLATYSSNCFSLKWMSPIKVFEYMASKTPFIATRIGRMAEICDNNECLFTEPENPKDLSEKIESLIQNEALRKDLAKNAYKKALKNTYIKRCEKILKYLS